VRKTANRKSPPAVSSKANGRLANGRLTNGKVVDFKGGQYIDECLEDPPSHGVSHKGHTSFLSSKSGSLLDHQDLQDKLREQENAPFFSKSFVGALRAMEKLNVWDSKNRKGLKRMSEQIIVFSKQEEEDEPTRSKFKDRTYTSKPIINRGKSSKSIVKLLAICNNRMKEELTKSIKKDIFDGELALD
jgi:hypothetical protein